MALTFDVSDSPDDRDAVAQLWAETTAARDGRNEIAPLDKSRPVIDAVLDGSARSVLLVGRDDQQVVAFAAAAPVDEQTAEVRYVGVSPRAWGGGVGTRLMTELRSALVGAGYERAELMVYIDNSRALRLYERQGWSANGEPTPHPRTGKLEQRYKLSL